MTEFTRLLAGQFTADARALPATVRRRLSEQGRVERCVNVADLRTLARRKLPRVVFDYVDGAAWDEVTSRRNQEDFAGLSLRPRFLVDVAEIDLSTTLLGRRLSLPIVGAPTGLTGLMHHRGELAVATELSAAGTIYTVSTASSYSLEQVAEAAPGAGWFQLYVWRDRGLVRELLERARAAGYLALVVTVDVPRAGPRERDLRNRFTVPPRISLRSCLEAVVRPRWSWNFVRRPGAARSNISSQTGVMNAVAMAQLINDQLDPSVTWSDLEWFRDVWQGPFLVKGILRHDDARRAVDLGAAGIVVSNHGGRQLDHALSAIRALEPVVQEIGSEAEVILDGGVRRGTDIVKAIALGARACMVGRGLVYGLSAGGDAGVRRAVEILSNELRVAMALAGCPSVASIDRTLVTAL